MVAERNILCCCLSTRESSAGSVGATTGRHVTGLRSTASGLVFLENGLGCSGLAGSTNSILLVFVDGPIEDIVVLESFTDEEITENFTEVGVVGLIVETEGTSVVEVDGKLVGEATAENFGRGSHLLLHDTIVLLLLGRSLQSLPRKGTTAEVKHNVSERLHVVTTGLLDTQMSIDRGITGSTSQVLVLTVRNVEVSLWVTVLLGQTEIDDIDLVTTFANAHQEVVRLDITVDEGLGMNVLNAGDELIGEEEDGLQGELAVAEVEEILQTGAEKVQDHGIVVTLSTKPADEGDADPTSEGFIDTSFIFELGVFGLHALELNGNLFTRDDIGSEVNVTETATTDLSSNAVFIADAKIHSSHLEVELWTLCIEMPDTRVEVVEMCVVTID